MTSADIRFAGAIPANPGFYVLTTFGDKDDYPIEIDQAPVLAWAIEEDSLAPYPITLEGVELDNVFILLPDGNVVRPWGEKFLSVEKWLHWQQAEYTEQHRGGE